VVEGLRDPKLPLARRSASAGPLGRLTPLQAARQPAMDRRSAVIRKQLDRVAEAAHRIFADAFEVEITLYEVGEGPGQQH